MSNLKRGKTRRVISLHLGSITLILLILTLKSQAPPFIGKEDDQATSKMEVHSNSKCFKKWSQSKSHLP